MSVKRVGVEIDLMTLPVAHDKVTVPSIIPRNISVPTCFKQRTEFRDICVFYSDIEISVYTCLFTQQGIDAPATINNDLNAMFIKKL